MPNLPEHLELKRTRVSCNWDAPTDTESILYTGAFAALGVDNTHLESFFKDLTIKINRLTEDDIEFDMIGIDAALANAFRRILIAEVPTMAIEKVFIRYNTSVIQDEVLSHRLGLIPIKVDPRLFDYKSDKDLPNEKNTIVFGLHVSCKQGSPRITGICSLIVQPIDIRLTLNMLFLVHLNNGKLLKVKTDELKWLPNGSQFPLSTENQASTSNVKTYTSFNSSQDSLPEFIKSPISIKHSDITIARLGPGQEIELEAHAVKGVGKEHAKWSPVSTAWYRMLPEVVLLQDMYGEKAEELKSKCPVGVFDIEDTAKGRKASVARPRACTLCRECIREEGWNEYVALRRKRDHFIFTIESSGALPPEVLFTEAIKILEDKCERVITELS